MKFPGYQKFPFFAGIPGLFYRYAPSDDHICDHSVLVCEQITGWGVTVGFLGDNSFLDIKNQTVPSILADTQVIFRKIFRTAAAISEQLIFFLDIPWFISCLSRKSRISPVLFLTFPSIWIFQILPVKKNIRIPPRIMPVKKAFLFLFLKKKRAFPVSVWSEYVHLFYSGEVSGERNQRLHLCHKLAVLSVPDLFHINFSAFAEIQKAFQIFSSYKMIT